MRLYVGNLSYTITSEEIESLFSSYGPVESVDLVTDRLTGQPRGFGFIEMPDQEAAKRAIQALDGQDVSGRTMRVREAHERPPVPTGPRRSNGNGYGGGRSGGNRRF